MKISDQRSLHIIHIYIIMIINNMIIIMMTKQMHCQTGGQAVDAPTGVLVMCAQPSPPVIYISVYLCNCIFVFSFISIIFISSHVFFFLLHIFLCLFICVPNRPCHISVYICLFIILMIQQSCILLFILVFFMFYVCLFVYPTPIFLCVMCICVCIFIGVNANFVCSIISDA